MELAWTVVAVGAGALAVPAALAAAYGWLLLAAACLVRRGGSGEASPPAPARFLVLIPAHDEARTLPVTLPAVRALRAPGPPPRIVVVADNCTDGTAEAARLVPGVEVLERHDPAAPGKDRALAWALERLAGDSWDALVVLDADTRPREDLLEAFARGLARGRAAQQAVYARPAPEALSAAGGTRFLGLLGRFLETRLFYAGKERLGLAVLLLGNGFCITREALHRVPPPTGSAVEDVAWSLRLHAAGIRPHLAEDARLETVVPGTAGALAVQRRRWAGGTLRLLVREAPRAALRGMARGDLLLVDAAWTLFAASRPLVLLLGLAGAAGTALARVAAPGVPALPLPAALFAPAALAAMVVAAAWCFAGIRPGTAGLLRAFPAAALAVGATLAGALPGGGAWRRTPREDGGEDSP